MSAQKKDDNKSFIIINKNGYSVLGNIYLIKSIGSTPNWLNTSELERLWNSFRDIIDFVDYWSAASSSSSPILNNTLVPYNSYSKNLLLHFLSRQHLARRFHALS